MSIKCGLCRKQTNPAERVFRVVTETRERIYPIRENANIFIRSERLEDGTFVKGKLDSSDDPGGVGQEIVKEVLACKECNLTYTSEAGISV